MNDCSNLSDYDDDKFLHNNTPKPRGRDEVAENNKRETSPERRLERGGRREKKADRKQEAAPFDRYRPDQKYNLWTNVKNTKEVTNADKCTVWAVLKEYAPLLPMIYSIKNGVYAVSDVYFHASIPVTHIKNRDLDPRPSSSESFESGNRYINWVQIREWCKAAGKLEVPLGGMALLEVESTYANREGFVTEFLNISLASYKVLFMKNDLPMAETCPPCTLTRGENMPNPSNHEADRLTRSYTERSRPREKEDRSDFSPRGGGRKSDGRSERMRRSRSQPPPSSRSRSKSQPPPSSRNSHYKRRPSPPRHILRKDRDDERERSRARSRSRPRGSGVDYLRVQQSDSGRRVYVDRDSSRDTGK